VRYILTENQLLNAIKKQSNFDRIMDDYISSFPEELKPKGEIIKKLIIDYIKKTGYNVKFLNSCSTGFAGVRTKDQVIICKPGKSLGDFVYTIFHEIRHEQQISDIKMLNPISEFDLEDFESLFEQYWEMELDADQFAKNMVGKLVMKSGLPIDFASQVLKLSPYIDKYPLMSTQIGNHLRQIIHIVKSLKKEGVEINDIQDIPMVKQHLDKLEDFF
jgi:hypothetical protein